MILEKMREMSLPSYTSFARFRLEEKECTGCGRCVASCPIHLLMLVDGKAQPNERYDHFRCITCQNCEAVCPTGAITIEGDYRVHSGHWRNERALIASNKESFHPGRREQPVQPNR
jgi:formate hydrogenlyase subunit 6/NADH:ubiquinone oxidoreductase subunit I